MLQTTDVCLMYASRYVGVSNQTLNAPGSRVHIQHHGSCCCCCCRHDVIPPGSHRRGRRRHVTPPGRRWCDFQAARRDDFASVRPRMRVYICPCLCVRLSWTTCDYIADWAPRQHGSSARRWQAATTKWCRSSDLIHCLVAVLPPPQGRVYVCLRLFGYLFVSSRGKI